MLDLGIISEATSLIAESEEKGRSFTNNEKHFIMEYAFKIHDLELVTSLISNMEKEKENDEAFMSKYGSLLEEQEVWISQLENLLVALEMYRIEEEKALRKITFALKVCGVDVSVDDIKNKDAEEIKKMVRK